MAMIALHGESFGKGSVSGIERHIRRTNNTYKNPQIKPERTHENYAIQECESRYFPTVMEKVNERTNMPTLRRDANVLTEFVFSSSHEYMTSLSRDEQKRLFMHVDAYLTGKFGQENVIYSVVHMDEYTPHLHFGFVPRTPELALSSKAVMTRGTLHHLQDDLPKYLKLCDFDLARGLENSPKKHLEPAEYKSAMELEKKQIEGKITQLKRNYNQLGSKNAEIKKILDKIESTELDYWKIEKITAQKSLLGKAKGVTFDDFVTLKQAAQQACKHATRIEKLEKQVEGVQGVHLRHQAEVRGILQDWGKSEKKLIALEDNYKELNTRMDCLLEAMEKNLGAKVTNALIGQAVQAAEQVINLALGDMGHSRRR